METIVLVGALVLGFSLGLYIASQISDWIDRNTKR